MKNINSPKKLNRGRPKKEKRIQRSIYVNSLINEFLKNQDNANNYLLRLIIDSNDFKKFLKNNKLKFSVDETHDYTQTTKTFFHKNLSF